MTAIKDAHALEMKPCPFCGNSASPDVECNEVTFWVVCNNVRDGCGCEGPYQSNSASAILAWNRRSIPTSTDGPEAGQFTIPPTEHSNQTGEVSVDLMQRVWANLYYDEEDAGNTFQGTLNDVVDWLANRNALP